MKAHDFALQPTGGRLNFGVGTAQTAAALRALADRVETFETSVDSVRVQSLAVSGDFTSTIVRLKLYERRDKAVDAAPENKARP